MVWFLRARWWGGGVVGLEREYQACPRRPGGSYKASWHPNVNQKSCGGHLWKAQQIWPPPSFLIRTSVCRPSCHFSNCWSFPVEGRLRLSRGRLGGMKGINPSPSIGPPTPSLPQRLFYTELQALGRGATHQKKSHIYLPLLKGC